jgi:hypothetical protein
MPTQQQACSTGCWCAQAVLSKTAPDAMMRHAVTLPTSPVACCASSNCKPRNRRRHLGQLFPWYTCPWAAPNTHAQAWLAAAGGRVPTLWRKGGGCPLLSIAAPLSLSRLSPTPVVFKGRPAMALPLLTRCPRRCLLTAHLKPASWLTACHAYIHAERQPQRCCTPGHASRACSHGRTGSQDSFVAHGCCAVASPCPFVLCFW